MNRDKNENFNYKEFTQLLSINGDAGIVTIVGVMREIFVIAVISVISYVKILLVIKCSYIITKT